MSTRRAQQKRVEAELRRERDRYRSLVAATAQIVWAADEAGDGVDSPSWQAFTGQSEQEFSGSGWLAAVHPADRATAAATWTAAVAKGEVYETEYRLRRADGQYRRVAARGVPVRDPDGSVREWVGTSSDVTDLRAAEEALRRERELLRAVTDGTTDAVYVKDAAGRYVLFNEAAARFVGRPVAEVLGQDDTALFEPDGARAVRERDRRVMESGRAETVEEVVTAAGVDRTFLSTKAPYRDATGAVAGVIGISRDITERRRAVEALRESEARFRTFVQWAGEAFYLFTATGAVADVNDRACETLGYTRDELIGRSFADIDPVTTADRLLEISRELDAVREVTVEAHHRRKDGTTYPVEARLSQFRSDGRVFTLALVRDITDRKRAEAEREQLATLVEHATDFIGMATLDGRVLFVNPAGLRTAGLESLEQARTKRIDDFVFPDVSELYRTVAFPQAVADGRWEGEVRFRHFVTGRPVVMWQRVFVIRSADRTTLFLATTAQDVTERKSLEEQFRQAQKLEAVGLLAGGIAHDFNNLLTIINGYGNLLLEAMPADAPDHEAVAEICTAGRRASTLVAQLLAFSRKQLLDPRVLDLNDVVAHTEKMLRRVIGEDVRVTTRLGPGLRPVKADPGQLEQVLLNLTVNARDAMPRGGALTIETANVDVTPDAGKTLDPGLYVRLRVADTGCGMTEEVRARIFEPFFTTKAAGHGTGLGLAMVYGFVKQSGGHVAVSSRPGAGTTFDLYFPVAAEAVAPAARGPVACSLPHGGQTVLVVEDESSVRQVIGVALRGRGYEVMEAEDAAEALALSAGHAGPVHLAVVDVVMPGAGGQEVADALRSRRPGMKVLFISGHSDDAVTRHGVPSGGEAFLHKPFTPAELLGQVQRILNGPPQRRQTPNG